MHHGNGFQSVEESVLHLLVCGPGKRILRKFHADLEADFTEHSVQKIRTHPVSVRIDAFEARAAHKRFQLRHGELRFPAREPFIDRDQNVLDDRIRMDRLRNVAETVAARPDNTEIFADERLRIREMLRESLMKHKVERTVRKRSVKSVPAD